jgi:hypothetical protein
VFIFILLWSSSFHVLISAKSVMLTISMEQSHCWVANSRSAGQISRLLWNLKIDYRVHNSPPLLSVINSFLYVWMFLLFCSWNYLADHDGTSDVPRAAMQYVSLNLLTLFYFKRCHSLYQNTARRNVLFRFLKVRPELLLTERSREDGIHMNQMELKLGFS